MSRILYDTHYVAKGSGMESDLFDNLKLELRRGCLILAVLAELRQEHYGYTLRKTLADHGLEIEESTLYPLLRRLESQGLLVSQWREENKRRQRLYRPSPARHRPLAAPVPARARINRALDQLLQRTRPSPSSTTTSP